MINRILYSQLEADLFQGKALIILGPRQVGKTTLLKKLLREKKHSFLNADDPTVRAILASANTVTLQQLIAGNNIIYIDEAQMVDGIGLTMKLITDEFPEVQLIATGSSALDLNNAISEPLTGRKWQYEMYPICWQEFEDHTGYLAAEQQLEHRLIYGMYPDVLVNPDHEKETLQELASSYLYKDILALTGIRKPELLVRLLQALAFQMGSEVSYNELSQLLQVDKKTVLTYIDLLEKAYIIFRLQSFSRNLRNEIKTNRKIYFWDNGLRNFIIANLNPLHLRQDKGALWENFLVSERTKIMHYNKEIYHPFFWRTSAGQEIDYVEDRGGSIYAYEFKWQKGNQKKMPASFTEAYQPQVAYISRENFREFLKEEGKV